MLVDLIRAIGAYLQDVFIAKLDGWVALGLIAQFLFSMRFLVQWIASERAGRSVVPVTFWLFSIGGGTLLLIYFRNLEFLRREHRGRRKAATAAE